MIHCHHVDLASFRKEVYEVVAAIPSGKVITYGQIALLLGFPHHSRLVGHVLRDVPPELHLPCHRVVNSQGRTAPTFQAQQRLLKSEGVTFKSNGNVDIKACQWEYMQL